jgi:plasmid stabilization system protein ParE
LTYTLHNGAADDLAEAARFYRREGSRALAARFLDEFERIANLLVEHPGIGTPTESQRRWFPLSGFPYAVIYRETGTGVRILVLRHQNRDPAHGDERR